jgi:hypothetical protein
LGGISPKARQKGFFAVDSTPMFGSYLSTPMIFRPSIISEKAWEENLSCQTEIVFSLSARWIFPLQLFGNRKNGKLAC